MKPPVVTISFLRDLKCRELWVQKIYLVPYGVGSVLQQNNDDQYLICEQQICSRLMFLLGVVEQDQVKRAHFRNHFMLNLFAKLVEMLTNANQRIVHWYLDLSRILDAIVLKIFLFMLKYLKNYLDP